MNRKISRTKNTSTERKLALGENKSTSALRNIAQVDGSNIFELLQDW